MKKRKTIIYGGIILLLVTGIVIGIFLSVKSNRTKGKFPSPFADNKQTAGKGKNAFKIIESYLKNCSDVDKRIEVLRLMKGTQDPQALEIVRRELDHPNENVRLEALDLLLEFNSEKIFSCVEKAQDDKSEEVRKTAILLLDNVENEGLSPGEVRLIGKALSDPSEEVRAAGLSVIRTKPMSEREEVAQTAINSPYPDVKDDILFMLAGDPSHKGVDIMIEGLRDSDMEFRDEILDYLDMIFFIRFSGYVETRRWWSQHKSEYDFSGVYKY